MNDYRQSRSAQAYEIGFTKSWQPARGYLVLKIVKTKSKSVGSNFFQEHQNQKLSEHSKMSSMNDKNEDFLEHIFKNVSMTIKEASTFDYYAALYTAFLRTDIIAINEPPKVFKLHD